MKLDRIEHWMSRGAQPSGKVLSFIRARRRSDQAEAAETADS